MTDVKLIFERVLDAPAPPLTTAAQTLGAARRSMRRRRAGAAAASALGAFAVTVIVAAPMALHGSARQQVTPGATPSAIASVDLSPTAEPTVTAPIPFEQTVLSVLLASIPAGYILPAAGTVSFNGSLNQVQGTQLNRNLDGTVEYIASTDVYRGDQASSVSVHVIVGPGAMPVVADPCSVPGPMHQGLDEGCQVVTSSGGLPVRLSYSTTVPGRVYRAAVAYPGVTVYTQEAPFGGMLQQAPMDPPVFGPTGLPELAANPGFRPTG
jgi:hypothetical protein